MLRYSRYTTNNTPLYFIISSFLSVKFDDPVTADNTTIYGILPHMWPSYNTIIVTVLYHMQTILKRILKAQK
jgi:hypothetical protein